MKFYYLTLCVSLLFVGCQTATDNSANETFEKNAQTILENIEGFQKENLDYSHYAKDFVMRGTSFGSSDSLSLADVMKSDKELWQNYDFKIIADPINLLPGVDRDTKKPDGSVRYYANWQVTRPATDSTLAKSGEIKLYSSFDFDADGKIVFQHSYGDFTGLIMHINDVERKVVAEAIEQ